MDSETDFNAWLANNTDTNDDDTPLADFNPEVRATKEVERYIAMPAPKDNVDVCEWWRQNKLNFPILFQVARTHLSIQATSCSSERGWSTAGHFSSGRRHSISGDNLVALVFLNRNMKFKQ